MAPAARDKVGALAAVARRAGGLLALAAAALCPSPAGAQVPPDVAWRTLETEHFRVTFPAGLEEVGRLAADRAEAAWAKLSDAFIEPPDEGRVEVLVTDHVDVSNGFANVAPYRRVTIYARPPVDGFALSYFHDWMEVVLTHELAHVLHLDVTGPLGRLLRGVFGRVAAPWPFFPEVGTPRWVVEGLATYYESALTPSGRVNGTYHDMVLRTSLAEGRFEDVGEASGESPLWPAGSRAYVYGSMFFTWLLERHGAERMADFVEAVGDQWIPYRLDAAAEDAFDVSFSDAWDAWRDELEAELAATRARIAATGPPTPIETLTEAARIGLYPALSPDGGALLYARSDGRSDSHLRLAAPDGSNGRELVRTNGASVFDWTSDGRIVFSQLDYTDAYHILADLWVADIDGEVRRLTRGERLDHPSVAPDGRIVAMRTEGGRAYLVEVAPLDGAVRALTEPRLEEAWAFPAVSPDGRWIAAVRWERAGSSDVVIMDRDGAQVERVTRDLALDLAPTWSSDGTLLWASDRSGIPNIYAVAIAAATGRAAGPVRQVTNVLTGVAFPSVGAQGRWIHLSAYHADGWEIARLPYEPAAWFDPQPLDARFTRAGVARAPSAMGSDPDPPPAEPESGGPPPGSAEGFAADGAVAPVREYRAWGTLVPSYWEPLYRAGLDVTLPGGREREVLGPSLGFATSASDLVGRHALSASVTWSTSGGRVSGRASYQWAGLGNPVLGLSVAQSWDAAGPLLGRRDGAEPPDTLFLRERERGVRLSAHFLGRDFRWARRLSLAGGLVWERRELLDGALEPSERYHLALPSSRLADASATLSLSSARGHAFALGLEEGVALTLRGRGRRELDVPDTLRGVSGADRAYQEAVGQVRAYRSFPLFGFSDHVIAARVAAGVAGGVGADRFHFDVGGASGRRESVTGFGLFGGSAYTFPVRGYPNGARFGRFAWSASAEYRFPIVLVNEAAGLFPLHLDRVGGALFVDAGNAWGPDSVDPLLDNPRRVTLMSAGAEVLARTLAFWAVVVDVRVGMAVPFRDGRDPSLYVRLGQSF